jgi:ABC-type amino acid transport substrate-binding protein
VSPSGWRRNLTILIVAACATLAGIAFVLIRQTKDNGSLDRVRTTGVLRVGMDASFPPFESLDAAGNAAGFDVELAQGIAARLGAQPQFVNIAFDGLYDALEAGRVDVVISGLPYDERRTRDVIYSQAYFNAGQVLLLRAGDDPGTGEAADVPSLLAGRRVAVEWGSMGDMQVRQLRKEIAGVEVLAEDNAQEALEALVVGRADAAVADAVSVLQFMGAHPNAVQVRLFLTDEPYAIATSPQSRLLAAAIDAALSDLRKSGTLDDLLQRWLGGAR